MPDERTAVFPELLVRARPDREAAVDPTRTPEAIEADLRAFRSRRRDWIAESFGSGEAAAFMRRAHTDRLTVVQTLERLVAELPAFRDLHQFEAVARELLKFEDAGPAVARLMTPDVLSQLARRR